MTTTVQKWGNSHGIRIPKFVLEAVNFSSDEKVEILASDGAIVIKKAVAPRAHKSIEELFEGYTGEYVKEDIDWGGPVGNEIW